MSTVTIEVGQTICALKLGITTHLVLVTSRLVSLITMSLRAVVKLILLQQFGPVVIVALLTGCTINIYHAPEPGLVAVEGSTSVTGDNSHVSASGISIKNTSFEGGHRILVINHL